MQGRLQNAPLQVIIHTQCAHCDQPLDLTLDNKLRVTVADPRAQPLVFEPDVDWANFHDANILDKY